MAWLQRLRAGVAEFFVRSNVIHARLDNATSTAELIGVLDRFLDDDLRYGLEWDDFISWRSEHQHVEAVRLRLCEFEPKLFSQSAADRLIYDQAVLVEREKLAALLGLSPRVSPPKEVGATPHPTR